MKIGLLVPTTSRGREWKSAEDSYVCNKLLDSLTRTQSANIHYVLYLGYDSDDAFYANHDVQQSIIGSAKRVKGCEVVFLSLDVRRGHLTRMWNILFQRAYDDDCEYFFQCGDDVVLLDEQWTEAAIDVLRANNGVGLTSPTDERWSHNQFLTQSIVSRKHMEIFGFYFPEEIDNWFCDNWINEVYAPAHKFPLRQRLRNDGGNPRYPIVHVPVLCAQLVHRDKQKLALFLQSMK